MPAAIHVPTIVQYLLGRRDAIVALMESPRAVWLGLVFVLSAGFAREYDAVSLLHEPWRLLIPLGASLLTSLLLYALLYGAAVSKSNSTRPAAIPALPENDTIAALANRPPLRGFWDLYPTFLTHYWMTAPLAWLYAIPVERFLSPHDAAVANYGFLAIVSIWRVLLISRAASVMFSAPFGLVLCLVLLFADTVVLATSFTIPQPVLQVMGGVRLNALERLNADVAGMSMCFSVLLWPILFAVATGYFSAKGVRWSMPAKPAQPRPMHRAAWLTAGLSIAVWTGILPFTQPEQFLRVRVEHELMHGDLRQGLAMMSERQLDDFPPHWSPPPRWSDRDFEPDLGEVLTIITTEPTAEWVQQIYWSTADALIEKYSLVGPPGPARNARRDTLAVYLDLHPDRERVIREHAPALRRRIQTATNLPGDEEAAAQADESRRLLQSIPGEDLLTAPSPAPHD